MAFPKVMWVLAPMTVLDKDNLAMLTQNYQMGWLVLRYRIEKLYKFGAHLNRSA